MRTLAFAAAPPTDLTAQLTALDKAPALAIAFASVEHDVAAVQACFRENGVRAVGCSAHGEIRGGELATGTVTGLFVFVEAEAFTVWTGLGGGIEAQAEALGREAAARYAEPQVLFFVGGLGVDGEAVVRALHRGGGAGLTVAGGMAADTLAMRRTYSFSDSDTLDPGIAAVVFDGARVRLGGGAVSGWEPFGAEHVITRATGSVAHEINGEPALAFVERFVGSATNDVPEGGVAAAMGQYPFQVQRAGGAALRAPMFPHDDGTSVVLAGGVSTGDRFRFSIAPGFEVIDETVAHFREGHARDRAAGLGPAAGVVLVSCVARRMAFGPMFEDELEALAAVYDAPLAGYLSFGEIGAKAGAPAALHNDTCCVVTLHSVS